MNHITRYSVKLSQRVLGHIHNNKSTPHPNLARNSPRSVFNTAHKRCNSNDHISKLERFTWKLRATLLGNHARNARNVSNARNVRARARARDAGSTSAPQLAAPRTLPALHTTRPTHTGRPTHNPPHAHKQPRPRPTGIGDEAGARSEIKRGSAHSLTPPAVRPETMYFCRYWNSRMTGMAARTAPAAKMPHGAVRSSAAHMYMPTARVN